MSDSKRIAALERLADDLKADVRDLRSQTQKIPVRMGGGGGGGGGANWKHYSIFPEITGDEVIWFDPEAQPWGAGEGDDHWFPMWDFSDRTGVPGTS